MACEIYDTLTDYSILQPAAEPVCRYDEVCPKTEMLCKWRRLLIAVDRNMAIEDTDEDREQNRALAMLEAKRNIVVSSEG